MVLPLLQQSVMFFNIAFSKLVLKKDLAWQQYVGAAAVVAGVCIAALPEDGGAGIFAGVRNASTNRELQPNSQPLPCIPRVLMRGMRGMQWAIMLLPVRMWVRFDMYLWLSAAGAAEVRRHLHCQHDVPSARQHHQGEGSRHKRSRPGLISSMLH